MRMLVTYDISVNKHRTKAAHILKEYGVRVQLSVFEVELEEGDREELMRRLRPLVDSSCDRLALYPIDKKGLRKVHWLGAGPLTTLPEEKPSFFIA